jgi:hypothetical protein
MGGIRTITLNELVGGAADLVNNCIKRRVTPSTFFEITNGEGMAQIDAILFKSNPDMYWKLKNARLKLNHTDTIAYIDAYNEKAKSMGITGYHVTLESITLITLIICIIVLLAKNEYMS